MTVRGGRQGRVCPNREKAQEGARGLWTEGDEGLDYGCGHLEVKSNVVHGPRAIGVHCLGGDEAAMNAR